MEFPGYFQRKGMNMKRIAIFTAVLLMSAGFALAGPIVPKDIGAGAKWFGHVNFEAIRSMKLVQDLKDKCPVHQQWAAKMEELAKKLGMNPMEDVQGATLYSDHYGGNLGVVLVYVKKLDREKMVSLLKEKHSDHKTSEYESRTLYSWTAGHQGKNLEMTGTFANDTLIVIGADAEQVKATLDVLDGKKPALSQDTPLLKGIALDALVASRGIDVPEDYRKTTRCPVIQNCKAATAVWTVKDGQIMGNYEFATVSEETAKNYKAIVDGLKAMGELRYSNIPAVKKVMDGLKCSAEGDSFTATCTTSLADVESAVKAVMEQKNLCPLCKKQHGPHEKCEATKK
jgi:hypothetical protein